MRFSPWASGRRFDDFETPASVTRRAMAPVVVAGTSIQAASVSGPGFEGPWAPSHTLEVPKPDNRECCSQRCEPASFLRAGCCRSRAFDAREVELVSRLVKFIQSIGMLVPQPPAADARGAGRAAANADDSL